MMGPVKRVPFTASGSTSVLRPTASCTGASSVAAPLPVPPLPPGSMPVVAAYNTSDFMGSLYNGLGWYNAIYAARCCRQDDDGFAADALHLPAARAGSDRKVSG